MKTNGNEPGPTVPRPPSVPIPKPNYWWPGGTDDEGNPVGPVWIPESSPDGRRS